MKRNFYMQKKCVTRKELVIVKSNKEAKEELKRNNAVMDFSLELYYSNKYKNNQEIDNNSRNSDNSIKTTTTRKPNKNKKNPKNKVKRCCCLG